MGIVCKGPRISNKPIFIARFNVDELYLFNDLTKDIFNTLLVTFQYGTYKVIIMLVKGFFSILQQRSLLLLLPQPRRLLSLLCWKRA